jgi:hypothetical protein
MSQAAAMGFISRWIDREMQTYMARTDGGTFDGAWYHIETTMRKCPEWELFICRHCNKEMLRQNKARSF